MCNGIICLVSKDGKTIYAGTGSHTALAKKHSVDIYDFVGFESYSLFRGPMKFDKNGRKRGGAGYYNGGYGSSKKADAKAKAFYRDVLSSPEKLRAFIKEHGLDEWSLEDLFNEKGMEAVNVLRGRDNEIANLKASETKLKLKNRIRELEIDRDSQIRSLIDNTNFGLAKKFPQYKPSITFTSDPNSLERQCRKNLGEYGFMSIPEIRNLVAEVVNIINENKNDIAKAKAKMRTALTDTINAMEKDSNSVFNEAEILAMVFSDESCRTEAWAK